MKKKYSNDTYEYNLSIVIPAYKGKFLEEALNSLCAQTDQRFRVYVGDDASPDELKTLCESYKNKLDICYKRFDENLGKSSLVQHWNRCVKLSNEPWCWLFCDDDIMEQQCVESFYKTIENVKHSYSVYRFNTSIIDANGDIFKVNPYHPEFETGTEFAISIFCAKRSSFVSEYIFSRQAFDSEGGFIDFPLAWCSDNASWIAFSGNQGIYTINGPLVLWRYSGFNISTPVDAYRDQKIDALFQYLTWFFNRIIKNDIILNAYDIRFLKKISVNWLYYQLFSVGPVGFMNYYSISRRMDSIFEMYWFQKVWGLLMVDYHVYKSRIRRKLSKIKTHSFHYGHKKGHING